MQEIGLWKRILFVGPLWSGSTSLQRMRVPEDLGHVVVGLDTGSLEIRNIQRGLFRRIQGKHYRLGLECEFRDKDLAGINIYIIDRFRNSTWAYSLLKMGSPY